MTNARRFKLIISIFALIGIFNHATFDSSLKIIAAQEIIMLPYLVDYFSNVYMMIPYQMKVSRTLITLTKILVWIMIVILIAPLSGIIIFRKGQLYLQLYQVVLNPPMVSLMLFELFVIYSISWYSSNVSRFIEKRAFS